MISDETADQLFKILDSREEWTVRPDGDYIPCHELERFVDFAYAESNGHAMLSFLDLGRVARTSDMCDGSTVDESNMRSLLRDYPGTFYRVGYHGAEILGAFICDLDDDMANILIGLVEQYPLYDESDHSMLEHEQMHDSWGEWAAQEVYGRLTDRVQDEWHAIGDERVSELLWDLVRAAQEGKAKRIGYGSGWECVQHNGAEVVWNWDEVVPYLASAISHTAHKLRKRGLIT